MKMRKLLFVIISILALAAAKETKASHLAGGELIYEYVGSNTWHFIFKFYRDCTGISEPTTFTMCYRNTCAGVSSSVTLNKWGPVLPSGDANGNSVSTGCSSKTTCDSFGSNIPGFREWWYEGNVTLSATCTDWVFWVAEAARNPQYNINAGNMHIEAHLDNTLASPNNSPYFLNKPVPYLCVNQYFCYNNAGFDVDGDSLVYSSIMPLTSTGTTGGCTYAPSGVGASTAMAATYNPATYPMPCVLFGVNPNTGLVCVQPTIIDKNTITILCEEYRNGIKIGSVMRDVQIATVSCVVVYPVTNLTPNSIQNLMFDINTLYYNSCPGDTIQFCAQITGPVDTATIVAWSDALTQAPGSTATITQQGTDTVNFCFVWAPNANQGGLTVITLNYKDTNCLYNAVATTASFSFPIYVLPKVQALKDTTICAGDTISLVALGATSFQWQTLPAGSNNNTMSCILCDTTNVWPSVTTSYMVTGNNTSSVCGDENDTVTVTVRYRPTISAGPDLTTCFNTSVNVNPVVTPAGQIYNYNWTVLGPGGNTTLSNTLTSKDQTMSYPLLTGLTSPHQYIINAFNPDLGPNVCYDSDTVDILYLGPIDVTFPNTDTAICDGGTVQVLGFGSTQYNYQWNPVNGVSNAGILTPSITPPVTGLTSYVVTASYPGCPNQLDTVNITVEPNPIVNAGADRIVCFDDTIRMAGSVTPAADPSLGINYAYTWAPGTTLDNTTILDPVFSTGVSTTFTLTATTPKGCTGSDVMYIQVIPRNFMNVSADGAICPNDTFALSASGAVSYYWQPSTFLSSGTDSNVLAYPINTTTYTLIGTNFYGCKDTAVRTLTVYQNATVDLDEEYIIYPGDSAILYASGNCSNFAWTPSNGLSATNIIDPIAQPNVSTQYVVFASTENGCITTDTCLVTVMPGSIVKLPNAFTPGNGSSDNDFFKVDRLGLASLAYLRVWDRWGNLVFETNDINKGWDGKFKGTPQPLGTYVYQIDAVTKEGSRFLKNGNLTLLR
jgi:gliding motility-associated-like protein